MSTNPYAPPNAEVRNIDSAGTEVAPPLWNPGAATAWSLIFSPAFGSYLQMLNWRALGEPESAQQSKNWFVGSLVYLAVLVVLGVVLPDSKAIDAVSRSGGLVYLLVWYSMSGKLQVHRVKTRFGKTYPRRSWGKPLLLAFLILIAYAGVAGILAYASLP